MRPNDLRKMMAQVQKMQQDMAEVQGRLAEETFEASAGGGVVTATVRGTGEVVRVDIDPTVTDDVEMLGDLVVAAVNQALRAAQDAAGERMGAVTGDLDLPPGLLG